MADATTPGLTFGRVLIAALLLARWVRKTRPGEERVGLLLPASVGGALANLGVTGGPGAGQLELHGWIRIHGDGD